MTLLLRILAAPVACALLVGCHVDLKIRRLHQPNPIVVRLAPVGGSAPEGFPVDAEVLVAGARTFDERCSPCHGPTGEGDGPLANVLPITPRNYRTDEFKWGTRPSDIVATVKSGRSDVMPSFEGVLSPQEIWTVSYVVWSWIPPERRQSDDAAALQRR